MIAPFDGPDSGEDPERTGPTHGDEETDDTAMQDLLAVIDLLDRAGKKMGQAGTEATSPGTLGDFTIVRVIGRGGMGVVYEAVQQSLNRRVALKILPAGSDEPRKIQRFRVEAMAAACLRHPHIVPVFLTGSEGDCHFYAMQLIEGRTVADLIPGRPSHRAAAEIGRQAAVALQYAHEQGVIHRDIKPSNLLVDASGWLWIGDFGLARVAGQSELTQSGAILGTLRYMSPEQAAGARSIVDHRTDVYSLGATLYELMAGRPVYEAGADDRLDILRQIAEGRPRRPRLVDPSIPRDLETIVLKALAREPNGRYATAGEMAEDLGRFLDGRPILAQPPGPLDRAARWARRNRAAMVAGLMVALAALLAVGGFAVWRDGMLRRHNRELTGALTRAESNEQSTRRLLYDSQMRLAQQAETTGQPELAQEILAGLVPEPDGPDLRGFEWHYLDRAIHRDVSVLADHDATTLLVSPDGRLLAAGGADGSLLRFDLAEGREIARTEAHRGEVAGLALSPDGRTLVSWATRDDGPGEVRMCDSATGRQIATFLPLDVAIRRAAFSNDGRTIAVLEHGLRGDRSRNRVTTLILADGAARPSPEFAPVPCDVMAISPDGKRLATALMDSPEVTLRDAATGRPEARLNHHTPGVGGLAFGPDGRTLASYSWIITFFDIPSRRELGALPVPALKHGEFSADGRRFAGAPDTGNDAVLIADIPKAPRRIPLEGISGHGLSVALSPDGREIACGGANQVAAIWDASTGKPRAAYPALAGALHCLAFSPDGRSLIFKAADGRLRAWHLGRASAPFIRIAAHEKEVWGLAFSPDGKTLACSSDDGDIKLWDPRDGSPISTLSGHGALVAAVAISRDGRTLASAGFEKTPEVRLWDIPTRKTRAVLFGHTDRVRAVAISPDGRHVASAGSDGTVRLWNARDGLPAGVIKGHTDTIRALAFAPDRSLLVSSGNDRMIRGVEVPGGREVFSISSPRQCSSLAFSPDGRTLASGDDWGNLSIWDAATWTRRKLVKGSDAAVWSLAFSPDGRTLAAACGDAKVRLWDHATGQMTLVLDGHPKRVNAVAFSPDGRTLASASHDGSVILWRGGRDAGR